MNLTKWEYVEVIVQYGGPLTGITGHLTYFKPDKTIFERTDKYHALMAELGLEGWELVSSTITPVNAIGNRQITHMFKRALPEAN